MIEATNLTKRYARKIAVDNLSFTAGSGVVTGLLGPKGAGKSTTLRLMLQLDRGRGHTLFGGKPYRALRQPLRHVGVALHPVCGHPGRRARSHLRMLAAAQGIPRRRVDEVLHLVGLSLVADRRLRTYTPGMTQRLGLAAALLGDPRALILDEPTNGLDPQGVNWLRGFLRRFAAEGRTVLVASRSLAEISAVADETVVIDQGRLVAAGPTDEFARSAGGPCVLVRTPHVERLAAILTTEGGEVSRGDGPLLSVAGFDRADIGELAFTHGIVLHELTEHVSPLDEELLRAIADHVGQPADPDQAVAAADGSVADSALAGEATGAEESTDRAASPNDGRRPAGPEVAAETPLPDRTAQDGQSAPDPRPEQGRSDRRQPVPVGAGPVDPPTLLLAAQPTGRPRPPGRAAETAAVTGRTDRVRHLGEEPDRQPHPGRRGRGSRALRLVRGESGRAQFRAERSGRSSTAVVDPHGDQHGGGGE